MKNRQATKVPFFVLAILLANFISTASAVTAPVTLESINPSDSTIGNELKSCPIPYSPAYCKCRPNDNPWLPILNKYRFENAGTEPICPWLETSKSQKSES